MDGGQTASWLFVLLQILFLDLVLSGDNAAVIAMACRTLPKRDASKAIVLGATGAILLRVLLTAIAGLLISIPFLKTISAFLLLVIAVNLSAAELEDDALLEHQGEGVRGNVVAAAIVIVMADAIMSLDNVVALAAITAGNFWLLAFGLALSIPILVYGSAALAALLDRVPALVVFGGLLLGWTAGDLAATDAAYAVWIAQQAPALAFVLPLAGALFVYFQSRWIIEARRAAGPKLAARPKPARTPKPEPKPKPLAPVAAAPAPMRMQPALPASAEPVEAATSDDLVMFLGLIGLFAVFGLFIGYFVFFTG